MECSLIRHSNLSDVVAYGGERAYTAGELLTDVAKVAQVLEGLDIVDQVLLVFESDAYLQLVSVLAAWAAGAEPIIPADTRRSTLTMLKDRESVSVVLHDTRSGLSHRVQDILGAQEFNVNMALIHEKLEKLWFKQIPSIVFSDGNCRGSSSERRVTSAELQSELQRLQVVFPYSPRSKVARSMASSHRYSWMWSVLKPLVDGAMFCTYKVLPTADVLKSLNEQAIDIWVTLPSHIRKAASVTEGESTLALVCMQGLPVSHSTTPFYGECLEVLCSMESGALATRSSPGEPFRVLDGITAYNKGITPYNEKLLGWLVNGVESEPTSVMLGELNEDGTVDYYGENCRFLPIKSKEGLDLDRWENELVEIFDVVDVGVGLCHLSTKGSSLVVAIQDHPSEQSRMEEWYSYLREKVPDTSIYLFELAQIPRDQLGRVIQPHMKALAGIDENGQLRATHLSLGPSESMETEVITEVHVPYDYRWFEGHFESYPVLPAAIQLEALIMPCIRKLNLMEMDTSFQFERLKFIRRIIPGSTVRVCIHSLPRGGIDFSVECDGTVCTSGRVVEAI